MPAAIQGAQALGGIVFKAAGVGFTVVPVNPGTADMSPQLQSAVSGGADAVGMVGDVTFCSSFLQAYNTLGLKLPRYVLSTCQDPSILDSATLDKALAGSYITTTTQASKSDLATLRGHHQEVPTRRRARTPTSAATRLDGVTPVLALAAIMKGSTQPVTAAGIKTQTETAKNVVDPALGRPHLHLQRDGHPAAQVGVLVVRRHRRHPGRQGRQGHRHQGLQPDAAVLEEARSARGRLALDNVGLGRDCPRQEQDRHRLLLVLA